MEGSFAHISCKFLETDRIITESIILENGLIEHVFGDMRRFNYEYLIKKMIQDIKEQVEHNKKSQTYQKQSPQIKEHKGFGTYFFPPIVIGKMLKPTVSEMVEGIKNIDFPTFDKKAFDIEFDHILVIIAKDGYLAVCVDDREKSLDILNTIMATSVLEGLESQTVREYELSQIDYVPETRNITGFSYDQRTIRNELFYGAQKEKILEHRRKEIDEDYFKKIMEKASKIFEDKDMAEDLRILLEAITHMKDSEFPQAFIMGWKIIEKYISQKWHKKQNTNKKIKTPDVVVMINDLKDELQEKYSDFTELRKIRNSYMHGKKTVTQKEAQKCVDISKELVLKNSNFL
ncbi:MAG: hypothetical protein EPO37_05740 [Nitrosarchaeum sp.]|nr:MAG: hypothetical protein EPO37_05740 [Nitrosarchaeum sp.]